MSEGSKCDLREDKYCQEMGDVVQETSGLAKGLVLLTFRNKKTFEKTKRMILYRATPKRTEVPTLLRVCPFCEAKLGSVKLEKGDGEG